MPDDHRIVLRAGALDHESEDEDGFNPTTDKIWQQNSALCRNFDELRNLYVQSTQINLQLQATCARLQNEKEEMQNALSKQLGRTTKEQQPAAAAVHEQCVRDYVTISAPCDEQGAQTRAADKLLPPCEGSSSRVHPSSHHRDAVVFDLEQAVQQLQDHLHNPEREKKALEAEVKRLQEVISQKEKQEQATKLLYADETELKLAKSRQEAERHREVRKALESEVADLRALLTAVEQASAEAELRHLHAIAELSKEKERLEEQMKNVEAKRRVAEESLSKAQKDLFWAGEQMDELRTKQNQASERCHDSELQARASKAERDELERKMEALKGERENDRLSHHRELRDLEVAAQAFWTIWLSKQEFVQSNFDELRRKQEEAAKDKRTSLCRKIDRLQKKLKHSHQQLARVMIGCNQLLVYKKESEAQLAVLENAKQLKHKVPAAADGFIARRLTKMREELSQMSTCQAKYLGNRIL